MTQEDKQLLQLLLVDLSARMSYGVICNTPKGDGYLCSINQTIFGTEYGINIKATTRDYFSDREVYIKPYLRPMPSMTKEEREKLEHLSDEYFGKALDKQIQESLLSSNRNESRILEYIASSVIVDWLNAHHFDYRGLIGKGLAIEVTEENNPYEN